ncbi:uncharacterized protein LOC105355020 isoform X3 [Oryzias latipes]|uniref:uncharacterized protein LOC105355020 isoform X3 n=1 Tax=Oryzias latipes TaxID=8090 RepID=UPI0009D91793|nr:uncharacterized protein LOC105355020 isoform X3 [Oryzias latipes]
MFFFVIVCHVCFLLTGLICCTRDSEGIHLSVPEDHHVCLPCEPSNSSDVIWTLRNRRVLVTRQGNYQTNQDHQHYVLSRSDLCLLQLDDSDDGEYRCNHQLVAELHVLMGHDFRVSAGWTLLLPCRGSSKPKQRWFRQREGGRREAIFTLFKNGTGKPEAKENSRLSYGNDALQIQDLQPEDAGEYLCNGILQAKVSVLSVPPEPTSIPSSSSTSPQSAVAITVVDLKKKRNPEKVLLTAAVVGLALIVVLMVVVCVLLTSIKCRRKKKKSRLAATQELHDTELQLWSTSSAPTETMELDSCSLPEEDIHYASLGRPTWRERPVWTPTNQSQVIYSSIITRPAAED